MKYLDLSYESPRQNLACDEALLNLCEEGYNDEILRFWESPVHFVTVGYANKVHENVHEKICAENNIPVIRRVSGGGTVVQGPGCFNYALILKIDPAGPTNTITATNRYVLEKTSTAVYSVVKNSVQIAGATDLALNGQKFSGNAQRRKLRFLLFHGTLLYDFSLPMIDKLLPFPPTTPSYRENRSHRDFIKNLPATSQQLKDALKTVWQSESTFSPVPQDKIDQLARTQYTSSEWNFRFP